MWRSEEHTADLRLLVEASDWPELFAEATACFGELVGGGDLPAGERREATVEVEGADAPATWVRYWRALLRLFTVEGLLAVEARVDPASSPSHVRAALVCVPVAALDSSRCEDIKAVTWHAAEAAPIPGGWRGRIVLDV